MSPLDSLGEGTKAIATFIKNAIIADAIGSVELKDLPGDVDQIVSLAVDKWDDADDFGVDALVVMLILVMCMQATTDLKAMQPPDADPRSHFPTY